MLQNLFNELIAKDFVSLVAEALLSLLSMFKLFKGFLHLFPEGDQQCESYGVFRRLWSSPLESIILFAPFALRPSLDPFATQLERNMLLAQAKLLLEVNSEAFAMRIMFSKASSKLFSRFDDYSCLDPLTSNNGLPSHEFDLGRLHLITPAYMENFCKDQPY